MTATSKAPCFVLINADGTEFADPGWDDTVRHYATKARAKERADDSDEPLTPKALDAPCIEIRCEDCGYTLDEEETICHFEDREQAIKAAADSGWAVKDGKAYCLSEDCVAEASQGGSAA